jgi:two-component system, response regulator PdtaR
MKVLVVEDEPLIGLGLEDELEGAGHIVVGPVSSTGAALRLAKQEKPAIALIDLDLRHTQDGAQLARELKSTLGVPSIVLTFDARNVEGCADSSLGVVSKPFALDSIPAALRVAAEILNGGKPPPPAIPPALRLFQ